MIAQSPNDIVLMRKAGEITKNTLDFAKTLIKAGISTQDLDKSIKKFIIDNNATPTFLGYQGFPGSACISVNDVVVHGIPSSKIILKEGDIVSVDIGVTYKGFNGDAARTFPVGKISAEKQKLIDVTQQCFFEGISHLYVGGKLGELSNAIQKHAESNGYSVVRELVGHGIGHELHEIPNIPNYGKTTEGITIPENIFLAIEPMINMGKRAIFLEKDGWTVRTRDGLPSAHYENTVLVTNNGVEILTL
ncbi:MAG: type I methionyl aminopeptidase [Clostridia bacterium]|nr:type I methionyl aminopeptidase [Clostridia bacterium]